MDLSLTPDEIAFREEVRGFLRDELPPELAAAGRRTTSVFMDPEFTLPWQRILHAKGWVAPAWPREHGGPGWSEMQRYLFAAECAEAAAPPLAPQGLKMVGPCLMRYGTPEQKAEVLPRILSGEDYWCQGYSEPGSGSDLASLQLRADRDGDHYVLNGSKIWTTHAQFANRMFALVRTRWEGKPQAGITFLLMDMEAPGLTVRPIITLAGEHEVNQVFFEDVRVPVSGRVGEENDGWTVAKYLLEFERGGSSAPGLKVRLARLREAARELPGDEGEPLASDAAFVRRLGEAEVAVEALSITELRTLAALASGGSPGAASSLLKMQGTETMQRVDELGLEAAGAYAALLPVDERGSNLPPVGPEASQTATARYLNNRAASIYGGSNEIQRDIIAKAVLRL